MGVTYILHSDDSPLEAPLAPPSHTTDIVYILRLEPTASAFELYVRAAREHARFLAAVGAFGRPLTLVDASCVSDRGVRCRLRECFAAWPIGRCALAFSTAHRQVLLRRCAFVG